MLAKHGLVTWGESARDSYEKTIDLVTRAEEYAASKMARAARVGAVTDPVVARETVHPNGPDPPGPPRREDG